MAREEETKDLPNGPTGGAVLATHFVVLGIAALLILVRVVLRLRVQRGSLLVSDALLFLAWGAAIATAAFDVVLYHHGLLMPYVTYGLKGWRPTDMQTLEYVLQMVWMSVIPCFLAFYLIKAAVLAVYLQLFPEHMKYHRIALYTVMAYVAGAFMESMGLHLFICLPIKTNWNVLDTTLPECPRENNATVFRVAWALNIIGNIMIFALPFSLIYKLQLSTKMIITVYAVIGLGLIDIAFSLTRYIEIELSVVNTASSLTLISLWSSLDVNIGVIVACLPALRPLLRQNMKSSTAGYYGSYGSGTSSQTPARLATIRCEQGFEVISEPNDGKPGSTVRSGPTHVVGGPMGPGANASAWDHDSHGEKLGTSDSDIELVTPSGSERRSKF